jgi:isoleucyl-tRNA synthetase
MYTSTQPGNARRFSSDLVGESLRKFMLTLWNTYAFFVIYANIDSFNPTAAPKDLARSELDQWILSELHQLVTDVTEDFEEYDPTDAGRAIQSFVDDLSNWYVRRSRRRFWKSENDEDKLAAYATLYECLVTVAKLMAPLAPFLAEEMYQNLVRSVDATAPESVHLAFYPEANLALVNPRLNADTRLVMRVVALGRAARSKANVRVRQPLSCLKVKVRADEEAETLRRLAGQVLEELNVKYLEVVGDESEVVEYKVKPNFGVLGPKYGKEVGRVVAALMGANPSAVAAAVRSGRELKLDGYTLAPDEALVEASSRPGYVIAEEAGYAVALCTELTPELVDEGLARELVHRLQTMRKNAGFEITDTIVTYFEGTPEIGRVMRRYEDYIRQETLSRALVEGAPPAGAHVEEHSVDGAKVLLGVKQNS